MPLGLIIIDWDEYEGAIEYYRYPEGLQIDNNYIQQIQISHNFIDSILIHEYAEFNAISYYNAEHGKTIALFLSKDEDGQYYWEIIRKIDSALLRHKNTGRLTEDSDSPEADDLKNELVAIFDLSREIYKAREEVLLELANKLSELKGIEHDLKRQISEFERRTDDPSTRIVLRLILKNPRTPAELSEGLGINPDNFNNILKRLEERGFIKIEKDKIILLL